jgi:hypothetical protein
MPTFSNRILAVDTAVAQRSAALHVPNPRSDRDALIAALVHNHDGATRIREERYKKDLTGPAAQPYQSSLY